jgi:hypothetical protein
MPFAPSRASALPVTFSERAEASASDLLVFEDTTISIPLANRDNQTPEPSLAVNGEVIFSTGNHYAQLSTDGGTSFHFIDPATAFPPAKTGFCCDLRTIYAPSRDLLVWTLQYASDASGNIVRLAVSKGQTNQATQVWSYFDSHAPGPARRFSPRASRRPTSASPVISLLIGDVFTSSSRRPRRFRRCVFL